MPDGKVLIVALGIGLAAYGVHAAYTGAKKVVKAVDHKVVKVVKAEAKR